jgi:hypothetical protein
MTWRRTLTAATVAGTIGATLTPALAQNGSQFREWTPSALADSAVAKPRAACATLVSLTGFEFSISTATVVPASNDAPEYCRVLGLIQPEIRFDVSLPAAWNGRLYMFGNGGYAGESLDAQGRLATARRRAASPSPRPTPDTTRRLNRSAALRAVRRNSSTTHSARCTSRRRRPRRLSARTTKARCGIRTSTAARPAADRV